MTYARSRPKELVPWIEDNNVPLLTNAIHRWSERSTKKDGFLSMWEYDTDHVIDAGGYNVQAKWMKENDLSQLGVERYRNDAPFYPWTVEQYHNWLCEHTNEFEWASVMDYACESRFDDLWNVQHRMEATLENTIKQFNMNPDYNLLPVLQGKSVEEYVESYDYLKDHGIPVDYVGLGTICRLSSEKEIVKLEQKIREKTKVKKIHGFGVKVASYKHGATFNTADSQAWVYGASNGKVYRLNKNDNDLSISHHKLPDDSKTRTVESFKNYYAYVTWLKSGKSALKNEVIQEQLNKNNISKVTA